MRRDALFCCLLGVLLVIVLGRPAPVAAHAWLDRAEPPPDSIMPTSPDRITLWFTEPVEPAFSEVDLLDAGGQPVTAAKASVSDDGRSMTLPLPALPDGNYTVAWRVLSTVDGHTTRSFYSLGVGAATTAPSAPPAPAAPDTPPLVLQAVARWLNFAGQALLVGGLFFRLLTSGSLGQPGGAVLPAAPRALRRRQLDQLALLCLAAGLLASLVVQVAVAAGGVAMGQAAVTLISGTRLGALWLARAVLVGALAGLLWRPVERGVRVWLALGMSLGLLLTTSLSGHGAATASGAVLATALDWLHLIATSAWLGGLAHLLVALGAAAPAGDGSTTDMRRLIDRFSMLAIASVVLLSLTGLYAARLHVGSFDALVTSDYGRVLLLKLGLLAPMLGLGAHNLLRLRPVLAALDRGAQRAGQLARRLGQVRGQFRHTVRAEWLLGLLILAATGVLTSLAPAVQPASEGLRVSERAGGSTLTLTVSPGLPGVNRLIVDVNGASASTPGQVILRLTPLDQELGEVEVTLPPVAPGRYAAEGRQLGVAGRWQAELIWRRDGQEDVRTAVRFAIPTDAGDTQATASPSVSPLWLAGLCLLAAGAAIVVVALVRRPRRWLAALMGAGSAALALGLYLVMIAGFPGAIPGAQAGNPIAPTQASVATGKVLYEAHCLACHGVTGRGDGPQAGQLATPPADLQVHVPAHPDSELFQLISAGIPGSPMLGFADQLSATERWHLVNYLRTLPNTGR